MKGLSHVTGGCMNHGCLGEKPKRNVVRVGSRSVRKIQGCMYFLLLGENVASTRSAPPPLLQSSQIALSFAKLSLFPEEQFIPSTHLVHPSLKHPLFCVIIDLFKDHY